jgi:hypothetical protein
VLGPFRTQKQAKDKLIEVLARTSPGVNVDDGHMLFGSYLEPPHRHRADHYQLDPRRTCFAHWCSQCAAWGQ